ncbi:TetR family transcriptional regulator [Tamaricihabitans halophyticus]|uniref:TetR family transcriptional regulator n=1 Tax=Tamaricihabitans halophyticus TaxID=1262583 RepID=A0A4R2RAK3_9PSEU|nr:TetR/AcrR family transcriptional regulator [Tamaricihabitans halophyticus]TCP56445.1 TetR family transcriptional regulator [Tamaricihabitans halophyticus]
MPNRDDPVRSADGRTTRWSGQRAKRRAQFIDAAMDAITQHGPGVSTEQIAAHAGLARSRVYRHFADAADLRAAIGQRAGELIIAELDPLLRLPAESPANTIHRAVRTLVDWIAKHIHIYRYVTQHAVPSGETDRPVVADIRASIAVRVRNLIDGYLRELQLDVPVSDLAAFSVVGLVESATERWLCEPGKLSQAELAALLSDWIWTMVDHVLRGYGVVLDPRRPLPVQPSSD